MLHALTLLPYVLHVSAGMIALIAGTVAVIARKGGYLHRGAGTIFVAAMVVMAIFAAYLAVVVPDQLVNLFIAAGDLRVVVAGGISGAPHIARHLWRMCLGLTLAAGSAFTNGFARLLPGPNHVPPAFFYPQFVPLVLLIFWMIRVRYTNWFKLHSPAQSA